MADDNLANPAVLGLTCFGLTTILLNVHNAGIVKDMNATILGMGLFVGGLAQVIAGIMEFRKGNTFGTTAFLAYGTFWMALVFFVVTEQLTVNLRPAKVVIGSSASGLAWFLAAWGVFTAFMLVGTLKVNRVLQFVFASLVVLFGLLAIHFWWFTGPGDTVAVLRIAGIVGIACGSSALYLAMAENLNEMYGKTVLPIWPMETDYKRPEDL